MKPIMNIRPSKALARLSTLLVALLCTVRSIAQSAPEKVDVNINAGGDTQWYGQPWVWVIGVAIFIIIIVAITRNNKNA